MARTHEQAGLREPAHRTSKVCAIDCEHLKVLALSVAHPACDFCRVAIQRMAVGVMTLFCEAEGYIVDNGIRESLTNPAQSETSGMSGNSVRENRETPSVTGSSRPVRLEKATSRCGEAIRLPADSSE
jgi:hypothetical protein